MQVAVTYLGAPLAIHVKANELCSLLFGDLLGYAFDFPSILQTLCLLSSYICPQRLPLTYIYELSEG